MNKWSDLHPRQGSNLRPTATQTVVITGVDWLPEKPFDQVL